MVFKRLAAAASALVLVAGVAHAQTKTPAQLTAQTSIASGDLFMVWPAASGGPLHQVQYGVLQSQLQAALGSTYLQGANNLSDLTSPSLARGNLGLGALATEANPTSAQVTTGLGFLPVHPTYTGESGAAHVIGIGWNNTHAVLDIDSGNFVGALAFSADLGAYAPLSGAAFTGAVSASAISASTYNGYVPANKAGDSFSGAVRAATSQPPIILAGGLIGSASASQLQSNYGLENSGATLLGWNLSNGGGESDAINNGQGGPGGFNWYFFSNSGALTSIMTLSATGTLTVPTSVNSPVFSGSLSGTASNASALQGETPTSGVVASSIMARDGSGNVAANTFVGALSGLASNSSALQGYTPTNNPTATTIPVRDGNGNINANTFNGALNGNAATATTASTANAGASGFTIGGQPAAYVQSNGSGAGSISYGTGAPGTLAVGAIYLQTN